MFSNPKRMKAARTGKESWFDYYAGFSTAFVRKALNDLLPDREGKVLDPWNGSGTTTAIAYELGIKSTGIDINPVMAVVAKAKLLAFGVKESLVPLAQDIVAKSCSGSSEVRADDPLLEWFSRSGARSVRALEQSIRKLLTPLGPAEPLTTSGALDSISDLAAFFFVALFRAARTFVCHFQATNPTWIRSPKTAQEKVRPNAEAMAREFIRNVEILIEGVVPLACDNATTILLGSSERLSVETASIQAVITSPPYCTRIDYAVATKPELAVLGCPLRTDFVDLRRRMTGGPVISPIQNLPDDSWGHACLDLLKQVKSHPTKGSEGYYYKLFVQYYGSIRRSLEEINRVLVANGHCVLVVQDSHYKEIHVDVARYIAEMALDLNWSLEKRLDFDTRQVMARMNPKAKKYRAHTGATESVLWFRAAS